MRSQVTGQPAAACAEIEYGSTRRIPQPVDSLLHLAKLTVPVPVSRHGWRAKALRRKLCEGSVVRFFKEVPEGIRLFATPEELRYRVGN